MPSKYRIEIYTPPRGVRVMLAWRGEHDYLLGKDFLENKLGIYCGKIKTLSGEIDFYQLETEAQFEALLDFRLELIDIFGPIVQPAEDDDA